MDLLLSPEALRDLQGISSYTREAWGERQEEL